MALCDDLLHLLCATRSKDTVYGLSEQLSGLFGRVLVRWPCRGGTPDVRPFPRHDCFQLGSRRVCQSDRPLQRLKGRLGAIHTDDDDAVLLNACNHFSTFQPRWPTRRRSLGHRNHRRDREP